MLNLLIDLTERGMVPNSLVRLGIRRLCGERLQSLKREVAQDQQAPHRYVDMLKTSPVALAVDSANAQHYEVPPDFFAKCLGPYRKYSCAYWPEDCHDLAQAEKRALEITVERAQIKDGMSILELGCGWGSLTLFMAEKFPNSKITAISNSASQREFIRLEARKRNLGNVDVLTCDVSEIGHEGPTGAKFDRVISIEMFEHLRNYETILGRIKNWLVPSGRLFIHIFTHRTFPYLFETEGADNWMGKYFFTGGQMPSHDLLRSFQRDLKIENEWSWNGTHYQKTAEAWLKNLDANKREVLAIFSQTYGEEHAVRWFNRWKIFYLAVAELFGYRHGTEWGVSHYLFSMAGAAS